MSTNHVVAWIDHKQAHVIHFTLDSAENEIIQNHSTHPHLHVKSGIPGSGHAAENASFFNDVANSIKDALEILIVGPGLEKLSLLKHLSKHYSAVADKVLSVETVDHPTDAQLLAYARKYFRRADQLR